jgi:hypothetical protein
LFVAKFTTTAVPSAAKALAMPVPMPCDAPVTNDRIANNPLFPRSVTPWPANLSRALLCLIDRLATPDADGDRLWRIAAGAPGR